MAIVFISPKANKIIFFKKAGTVLALVLVAVILTFSIILLLGNGQNSSANNIAGQKNIAINFTIIDSAKVSDLKPFYSMGAEFSYVVTDKSGKQIQGNISAVTIDEAKASLEASGFTIVSLKEMGIVRGQPFISY